MHTPPTSAIQGVEFDVDVRRLSPTVARLLHQLQAQIIREADDAAHLNWQPWPAGTIVLQPIEAADSRVIESDGYGGDQYLRVSSANGDVVMYRDHLPRTGLLKWHPAHWWGSEGRLGPDGRDWRTVLPRHVMDDFGALVPVAS